MAEDRICPEECAALPAALTVTAADPAGNLTLLVESPVPRGGYERAASALLAMPALGAEQVGFLVPPQRGGAVRLEMMGGEFCGNAVRCAGLWYAARHGCGGSVPVEISGCSRVLQVDVDLSRGTAWAEMPLPERIERARYCGADMEAVYFEGMLHLVAALPPLPKQEIRTLLPALAEQTQMPAAGIMFVEGEKMTPAVYVRDTDSLVWERSCASGSTAAACCAALRHGDGLHRLALRQPGGVIGTETAVRDGQIVSVRIGGSIRLGSPRQIALRGE